MKKIFLKSAVALFVMILAGNDVMAKRHAESVESDVVSVNNSSTDGIETGSSNTVVSSESDTSKVKTKRVKDFDEWNTTRKGWGYGMRVGFAMGGTTPLPIPSEMRSIDKFGLDGGLMQEIYIYREFSDRWGIYIGERLAWEGMAATATVKNYSMSFIQGDSEVSGFYTGVDETNASNLSIKVPLQARFLARPRWALRFGPYMQFNLKKKFSGLVYDGYLRETDPTGPKIVLSADSPCEYDFSDDLRTVLWGLEFGFDFKITKHFGAFAHLDWGMNNVFKDDFKTITFVMKPVYFSLGLFVGI